MVRSFPHSTPLFPSHLPNYTTHHHPAFSGFFFLVSVLRWVWVVLSGDDGSFLSPSPLNLPPFPSHLPLYPSFPSSTYPLTLPPDGRSFVGWRKEGLERGRLCVVVGRMRVVGSFHSSSVLLPSPSLPSHSLVLRPPSSILTPSIHVPDSKMGLVKRVETEPFVNRNLC